jgi:hypothetical protein
MNHFVPCPGCNRHVRAASSTCPFCGDSLPEAPALGPSPPRGISRSAILAFGAAVIAAGAAGTACGGSTAPNASGGSNTGNGNNATVAGDGAGGQAPVDVPHEDQRRRRHWDGTGNAPPYGSPPFESA